MSYGMSTICGRCGDSYGKHKGLTCPDGARNGFFPAEERQVKEPFDKYTDEVCGRCNMRHGHHYGFDACPDEAITGPNHLGLSFTSTGKFRKKAADEYTAAGDSKQYRPFLAKAAAKPRAKPGAKPKAPRKALLLLENRPH